MAVDDGNLHKLTRLVYVFLFLGVLFGVTALIGVIINHANYHRTAGSHLRSHFVWQMITFWSLFIMAAVIFLYWSTTVASVLIIVGGVWWLAALVTGIYYLRADQAVPFVNSDASR